VNAVVNTGGNVLNQVSNTAGDALNLVRDIAEGASSVFDDPVKSAANWIWDNVISKVTNTLVDGVNIVGSTIGQYVPRSAEMQFSSVVDSVFWQTNIGTLVTQSCADRTRLADNVDCTGETGMDGPPSQCSSDVQCRDDPARDMCLSPSKLLYPECTRTGALPETYNWDSRCLCSTTSEAHCDLATGLCSVGRSPYQDQVLARCPVKGKAAFVDSEPEFDAMCYVAPTWKCASSSDPFDICRINQIKVRWGLRPQTPAPRGGRE
jgi:hypothetical protein